MSMCDVLKNSAYLAVTFGLLSWILLRRKQAGRLMCALDRGWLATLLSGFVTAIFVFDTIRYSTGKIGDFVAIIIWCMNGIFISLGSRIELRENGLWHNYSLVRWSSIADYRWEGKPPVTLVINFRDKVPSRKQKTYQISARYKDFVDQELQQRVVVAKEPT